MSRITVDWQAADRIIKRYGLACAIPEPVRAAVRERLAGAVVALAFGAGGRLDPSRSRCAWARQLLEAMRPWIRANRPATKRTPVPERN